MMPPDAHTAEANILDPLSGAIWAAGRGFHTFAVDHPDLPRCVGLRTEEHDPSACSDRGKHPAERFTKNSTTDVHEIAARFSGRTRNFGIYCADSGLLVADDDTGDALADYAESIGETIPHTITVMTARGLHYYFAAPSGMKLSNKTGELPEKIDIRAGNAYVVGPGSVHATGSVYHLVDPNAPLAPAPAWLIHAITTKPNVEPFTAPDMTHNGTIPKGKRHQELVKYAARLRHRHLDLDEAIALTKIRWRDCEQPAGDHFGEDRVETLVRDIFARYAPDQAPDVSMFDIEVAAEAHRLRVRDAAREVVRSEQMPPQPEVSPYLSRLQLDELPTPDSLIEGTLSRHSYGLLVGRDSTFKSFTAVDWSLCLATGKRWQGRDTERVPVLYMAGEGAYGLAGRVRAWESAWDTKVPDDMFWVRQSAVNMFRPGADFQELITFIDDHAIGLVVIDTLAKVSAGANMAGSDSSQVLASIEQLKAATNNGSVLVIAHTQKADVDVSGLHQIEDNADSIWHASVEDAVITLRNRKQKDSGLSGDIHLKTERHDDSLILVNASGVQRREASTDAQRVILETLDLSFSETGATKGELKQAVEVAPSTFYRAFNSLLASGQITHDGAKTPRYFAADSHQCPTGDSHEIPTRFPPEGANP